MVSRSLSVSLASRGDFGIDCASLDGRRAPYTYLIRVPDGGHDYHRYDFYISIYERVTVSSVLLLDRSSAASGDGRGRFVAI